MISSLVSWSSSPSFIKKVLNNEYKSKVEELNRNREQEVDKEINKLLAKQWEALSIEQRTPYEAEAAADKERYEKEMEEYRKE